MQGKHAGTRWKPFKRITRSLLLCLCVSSIFYFAVFKIVGVELFSFIIFAIAPLFLGFIGFMVLISKFGIHNLLQDTYYITITNLNVLFVLLLPFNARYILTLLFPVFIAAGLIYNLVKSRR